MPFQKIFFAPFYKVLLVVATGNSFYKVMKTYQLTYFCGSHIINSQFTLTSNFVPILWNVSFGIPLQYVAILTNIGYQNQNKS